MNEVLVVEYWHKGEDSQKFVTLDDFAKLSDQLREANEVIGFYANKKSWTHCHLPGSGLGNSVIIELDREQPEYPLDRYYEGPAGGIKAREYEKKYMTPK